MNLTLPTEMLGNSPPPGAKSALPVPDGFKDMVGEAGNSAARSPKGADAKKLETTTEATTGPETEAVDGSAGDLLAGEGLGILPTPQTVTVTPQPVLSVGAELGKVLGTSGVANAASLAQASVAAGSMFQLVDGAAVQTVALPVSAVDAATVQALATKVQPAAASAAQPKVSAAQAAFAVPGAIVAGATPDGAAVSLQSETISATGTSSIVTLSQDVVATAGTQVTIAANPGQKAFSTELRSTRTGTAQGQGAVLNVTTGETRVPAMADTATAAETAVPGPTQKQSIDSATAQPTFLTSVPNAGNPILDPAANILSAELLQASLDESTTLNLADRISEIRAANAPEMQTKPPAKPFAEALVAQVKAVDVKEGRTLVSLHPRGLGQIEIDVVTDKETGTRVVVRVENPAVLQTLRDERQLLADSLGLTDTTSFEFEQGFSDEQAKQEQQKSSNGNHLDDAFSSVSSGVMHKDVVDDDQLDILT